MANITVEDLFRHRNVMGVRSQYKAPATPMSNFYGIGPGSVRERSEVREFSRDIYNNTRLLANVRPPKTGPAKVRRHPVGKFDVHVIRLHEELDIFDEDIMKYRPIGGKIGDLDESGQAWVGREMGRLMQRFGNTNEFMVTRMFRNGFGVKKDDDNYSLVEKSASGYTFNVDYQIPSTNVGNCDSIFSDLWSSSSTNIPAQILALNAAAERVSGHPISVCWINSTVLTYLYNNTIIRNISGTWVRIFDSQTGQEVSTIGGPNRSSGYVVTFTAIPNVVFHVTDVVQNVDQKVDSQTAANSSKVMPDARALFTPAPGGDWYSIVESGEPIRELPNRPESQMRYGFYSWQCPFEKPPGRTLTAVDNYLPVLDIPAAVFYATIA
jgi:hypothetical protein